MVEPMTMAALAGGAALLGGGASYLGQRSQQRAQERMNKPYRQTQERRNRLIDELLASVEGGGKYSQLFDMSDADFQRSFVDPAMSRFRNQVTPQIQQSFISGGMQRGSGIEDTLSRAGVDLNQMLNESYSTFQSQGKDRMSNMLMGILGQQPTSPLQAPLTPGAAAAGTLSGFMSSPAFGQMLAGGFKGSGGGGFGGGGTFQGTQAQRDMLNPTSSAAQNSSLSSNRPGFAYS